MGANRHHNPAVLAVDPADITEEWRWLLKDLELACMFHQSGNTSLIRDFTSHRNHGTITGATWDTTDIGPVLDFDGANDEIDFGDLPDMRFLHDGEFTVNIVFRLDNTAASDRTLVAKFAGTNHFLIRTTSGAAPRPINVQHNGSSKITSASAIELNTWYSLVLTHDNDNEFKLFVYDIDSDDFVLDDVGGVTSSNPADLTARVQIGLRDTAGDLDGQVANVLFISAALSDRRARFLAREFRGIFTKAKRHAVGAAMKSKSANSLLGMLG